jgi:hypothetical protein
MRKLLLGGDVGAVARKFSLPKALYRVAIVGADHMRYAEKGGGTFASERTAFDREARLKRDHPEAEVKVFVTVCDWKEL